MAVEREVYIKILAKDGTSKTINVIAEALRRLQKEISKSDSGSTDKTASYKSASYNSAIKDIEKMRQQNLKWEKAAAAEITRSDKITADNKIREAKRGANAVINSLNQIQKQSELSAKNSSSVFSSALGGSFFGTLGANITTKFLGAIAQIPSAVRGVLDEAVRLSEERTNALKGLESIAIFKGIDTNAAQQSVQNLRLVKAGIVDLSAGSQALKSLLSTGFGLDQANTLLERFSDAAAFGKQSALTFNEAIERTAEGLKQGNSNLFDASGITKNLSVILKEQGFELEDLSDKTKKQAALQSLYNGILEETQAQVGDAEKITRGWTGATAALSQAQNNLYASIGDIITRNPDLISLIKTLMFELNESAKSFQTSDTKGKDFNATLEGIPENADNAGKSLNRTTTSLAELILKVEIFGRQFDAAMRVAQIRASELAEHMKNVGRLVISGLYELVNYGFVKPVNAVIDSINDLINRIPEAARPFAGILDNLGQNPLPRLREDTPSSYSEISQRDMTARIKADLDAKDIWNNTNEEIKRLRENFDKYRSESVTELKKANNPLKPKAGDTTASGSSGGSKKRGGITPGESFDKQFRKFADDMDFIVRRTKGGNLQGKSGGSLHPLSLAGDLSIRGKSVQEIVDAIAEGIKRGWRAVDERFVGAIPGVRTTGPNTHFEKNPRKASLFVENRPDLYGGQDVLDFLKKLDADRLNKTGVSTTALNKFRADQTKEADDAALKKQKTFIDNLEKLTELSREAREEQDKYRESWDEFLETISEKGDDQLQNLQQEIELLGATTDAERQRIQNTQEIITLRRQLKDNSPQEIEEAVKALQLSQEQLDVLRETLRVKQLSKSAEDYGKDLYSELEALQRNGRELTEYEKVQREINENYKDLSASEKQSLLDKAALIDSQKLFNEQYNQTYDFIRDSLDVLTDSSKSIGERLKDFFGGIVQSLKKMFLDAAASFLTSKLFKLLNPNSNNGGSSGGGLWGIIKNFIGGGSGNRGGSSSGSNANPLNAIGGLLSGGGFGGSSGGLHEAIHAGAGNSGGFSSIFGSQGFGNNVGTYGALGTFAALGGGLVGGRVGGFISGAGSGLAIGAKIGSLFGPGIGTALGAGIGAVAGGLISLLGGGKQRKADEKSRTEYLTDAFKGLDSLDAILKASNALKYEPPASALTEAESLISSIRQQYLDASAQLKDKKTRGIALKDVSRIDDVSRNKLDQIRTSVKTAEAASDTRKRLGVAEFAKGGFTDSAFMSRFGTFKREYGLLKGGTPGKDSIPVLAMAEEMFLTRQHQKDIIRGVGYDPFHAHTNIPNYPAPMKMAAGGFIGTPSVSTSSLSAPQIVFQPNITIVVEGEVDAARIKDVFVDSLDNTNVQVKIAKANSRGKSYGRVQD